MNIVIFKTSVQDQKDLKVITPLMNILFGEKNWSFALDDEDKILRVVCSVPCTNLIIQILKEMGFRCEEMPYSLH